MKLNHLFAAVVAAVLCLYGCKPDKVVDNGQEQEKTDTGEEPGGNTGGEQGGENGGEGGENGGENGGEGGGEGGGEEVTVPKADILDLVFYNDGSVEDISGGGMKITSYPSARMVNYYNEGCGLYVAHFSHPSPAKVSSGYIRADYASLTGVRDKLADGHTLECLFRSDILSDGSAEIKMFSAMQSGGTGFLISKASRGTQLTFLPNISTSGSSNWIWNGSGIIPEPGRYYHVIGVYDKEAAECRIYVDGELKGTTAAPGNMVFPSNASKYWWFGIGADAADGQGDSAWNGDVAIARIYDKPLDSDEVKALYEKSALAVPAQKIPSLKDLAWLGICTLGEGYRYNIFGEGFASGDSVRMESVTDESIVYTPQTALSGDHLSVTIPSGMKSGDYRMMHVRSSDSYPIGTASITVAEGSVPAKTRVVAHRAIHNTGAPENSLEALQKAEAVSGLYGAEIDVWITKDGYVVINHDATYPTDAASHRIEESNLSDLSDIRLSNGESVPKLEDFLEIIAKGDVHLVIEIKTHSTEARNFACVDSCMAKVSRYGLDDKVDWIAFSYDNCRRIATARPKATVEYLNGDMAPVAVYAAGINGIDYKTTKLRDDWIAEAHRLGMVVNVWTVDSEGDMLTYIGKGVDFITTNQPQTCLSLLEKEYIEKP